MSALRAGQQEPRLTVEDVAESLGAHLAMYRHKAPRYQTEMLNNTLRLWQRPHRRLLDVGGGTGVIGQCMQDLFPVGEVLSVDVVDRFCASLSIAHRVFDGVTLPFADGEFDAAALHNVVHHVPVASRVQLFREIRRVVAGPLYIKDHLAKNHLDHARLGLLDAIGNIPFGGMVKALYLSRSDWGHLASASGFRIATETCGRYRHGPYSALFPNRLETTMRWEPA